MYSINTETKEIILPLGDTLAFVVDLKLDGEPARFPEGTVAIFGVCKERARNVRWLFSRVFPVEDGSVAIYLTNDDTRDMQAGEYNWDLRIVTDPEYDEDGTVRCDDPSDVVTSIFAGSGDLPDFRLKGVAAYV